MGKRKNIIEKFIVLIEKKYKSIEKDFDESINLSDSLKLIDAVFVENEEDDYSKFKEIHSEQLQSLLDLLIKEDEEELKTSISASHFLITNGIDLVEEQKDKLSELSYRANIKRRNLKRAISKKETSVEAISVYKDLEEKLNSLTTSGFLDSSTTKKLFENLNLNEEEKETYLKEILKFNCARFKELSKDIDVPEAIEMLEIVDDIDIIEPAMTEEQLKEMFEKHGYDIKILDDELLNYLLLNGDLKNIDEVFDSIKNNRLNFLSNDEKDAKMLTKFLIESNKEIIDRVCKVFKSEHIDSEFLKNYKVVFFPSKDDKTVEIVKKSNKREDNGIDIVVDEETTKGPLSNLDITGKYEEFLKNVELFSSLGYDIKSLLERNVKLVTTANKTILRHIDELKLYEYLVGEQNFPLSAISSYRIMEITDGFIELGEEQYIKKYASRLEAYTDGTLERLYALKIKGMPYKVTVGVTEKLHSFVTNHKQDCGLLPEQIEKIVPKDVDTILKGNKFSRLLDEYLPMTISSDTLENPIVKSIDRQYMKNNCTYNFDGVLVSRKKLLRNFEFLMSTDLIPEEEKDTEQIMLVSAIYNSKLNMDGIEKVSNGLSSCTKIGGNDEVLKK